MPLPSGRVIDARWSRHHQPVAKGAMNAACEIGVPDGPPVEVTIDGHTDTVQAWTSDYTGPCRIQQLAVGTSRAPHADQILSTATHLVAIPADAPPAEPGARVKVTAALNDPLLIGRDLWVVTVGFGSERFERDLWCSTDQTDAPSTQ